MSVRIRSDDLWVRTAIDLSNVDLSSVAWGLGVDNGYKLYANGTFIGIGNAEFYTHRSEYSGDFDGVLTQGVNTFAVALEDHGGATAFDMEITGVVNVTPPVVEASVDTDTL